MSLLHAKRLLDLFFIPTKYYQIISQYGSYGLYKVSASGDIPS